MGDIVNIFHTLCANQWWVFAWMHGVVIDPMYGIIREETIFRKPKVQFKPRACMKRGLRAVFHYRQHLLRDKHDLKCITLYKSLLKVIEIY